MSNPQQRVARPYGRGTGVPGPVDVHVGAAIRTRRLFLGIPGEAVRRRVFDLVRSLAIGTAPEHSA